MNFIRTFTIFRYLTRQCAFHVFHIWLKLARAVGKIWNPLCFKQSLRGPSYPKPKSLGQSGDANFCVYMYGFACHNLRIPMTRRMSRLIKADPFRSSCHPPTGHPVDLVVHPSSSLSKSAVFRPHGQQQLAKDGWIAALAAWLNNPKSVNWVEFTIKDHV